ncbi:MAG: DUF4417 domain-containing protein [Thermoguttaceae bacterium]|nr:DUF4417 domain-containing protein [Thermoguttaceae bacterium]
MTNKRRKAVIDDGMSSELVNGSDFDGYFGIPVIKKPEKIIIPKRIIPFSKLDKAETFEDAIATYEMDQKFSDLLINPDSYIGVLKEHIFISLDCSLYRNAPYSVQVANVYRNRAIGSYYQRKGIYVIPQIRWGNELTYTTGVFPEKIAFLGVEKNSIVAIGTYGCSQTRDDKYHLKTGLEAMLETLEPVVVLVYGAMPKSVFKDFLNTTEFVHYPDWTTNTHKGGNC